MGFELRAIVLALFLASASAAIGQERTTIDVSDSRKDTELVIAKLLKEKLNINPALKIRGGDPDDLLLHIQLSENKALGIPRIGFLVDTQIFRRDKAGDAISQVIDIDSFAEIRPKSDNPDALLAWANKWNSRPVPIRIFIAGENIVVGQNFLTTRKAPLPVSQLLTSFTTIVQLWPVVVKDLRDKNLIE